MQCRLSLFGPPRLLDEQGKLVPVPAKTFALCAFLLLDSAGAPAGRASLRQFLWEGASAKTAATNLRKFLLRVRKRQEEHGVELIRCERSHVELAPAVEADLAEFLVLVSEPGGADLVRLCSLYRGDLLEGVESEEAESREWLQLNRTKLRDAFISTVAGRLEPVTPDRDRMALRIAARRLIEVDLYNETGHRSLMRHFAEDGERARVREVYGNLERRLRDDLGVEPDEETVALYRSLLPTGATMEAEARRDLIEPIFAAASHEVLGQEEIAIDPLQSFPAVREHRSGTPRITVLPPLPLSAQDSSHHIAASLIEDVTIGLCRFKALSVVAPHTASQLNENAKRSLLQTYDIDYAAETRLLNRGGELWLSVKLMDAIGRNILWTEQYAFDVGQMARQYRELSVQIVRSLVERIERIELARYDAVPDPTAYHLYLAGQRDLRILDLPNARRARRAFKSALGTNPQFVPAIAGLARTFQLEWLLMARGEGGLLAEAERLARLSVEIDPDDSRGYRELGVCSLYAGRFDESLHAFDQAEQRNAQHADLLVDYADALEHACDPNAALEKVSHAIALNPLCPDWYWWVAGGANFHLRRYQDAIASMGRMHDKSPAYRLLAASWAMLGEREQAGTYVRKTKEIHPDFNVRGWLSILPIRNREYAEHYEHSLRVAGFNGS